MRTLLALASAVLIAGCIVPEPEPTANLLGYCPQWVQGPGQYAQTVALDGTTPAVVRIDAPPQQDGRVLDLYRMRVDSLDSEGVVHVHAYADANLTSGRNWYDYRSSGQPFQSVPFLVLRGGTNSTAGDFDVLLNPIKQSDLPSAAPLHVVWRMAEGARATVSFTVTFHYRVCGAP